MGYIRSKQLRSKRYSLLLGMCKAVSFQEKTNLGSRISLRKPTLQIFRRYLRRGVLVQPQLSENDGTDHHSPGLINWIFALPAVYTIDSFGRRNLVYDIPRP